MLLVRTSTVPPKRVKKQLSQVVDNSDNNFELNLGHETKIRKDDMVDSAVGDDDDASSEQCYGFDPSEITRQYPPCENIDDAIGSLYNVSYPEFYECSTKCQVHFDYDWLLDGEVNSFREGQEEEEPEESYMFRRKPPLSGDEALDCVLAGMELESFSQEESFDSNAPPPSITSNILSLSKNECPYSSIDIKTFDEISQSSELSDTDIFPSPEKHSRFAMDDYYTCTIPIFLPYEDPSTPEGAFFRRIQVERDSLLESIDKDDVCEDVTSVFYRQDSDPVLDYLHKAPWGAILESDSDGSDMEKYLLTALSSLDMASKNLHNKLLREIQKKEKDIDNELNNVQTINWDVSASLSYARQVSSYIHQLKGQEKDGMGGSEIIVCHANLRNKLNQIDMLFQDIEEIVKNEAAVFSFCDSFAANIMTKGDCMVNLLETCQSLKKRLFHDERFQCISCLDEARDRVSLVFGYISKKIEEELIMFLFRGCRKSDFDSDDWNDERLVEYTSLLNARLNVNEFQLKECIENKNDGMHIHEYEKENVAEQWANCIYKAFCFEADRCLAMALLEPSKVSSDSNSESFFDDNIEQMKSEVGDIKAFSENAPTLRKIVKNSISIRFEFEKGKDMLPKIFHRLCLNLASLMHSYSSFMEWHHFPSNRDLSRCDSGFLRRDSSTDEKKYETRIEVEKLDAMKDDNTKSSISSKCSTSSALLQQPLISTLPKSQEDSRTPKWKDLKTTSDIYIYMFNARGKLWENICTVMETVLEAAIDASSETDSNSGFSSWSQELQCLHCVFRLCIQMDCFAKHFLSGDDSNIALLSTCSSDDSQSSSEPSSLMRLFRSFLRKAHVASMTEVGTMMSEENWELLPIKMKEGTPTANLVRESIHSYLEDLEPVQSISDTDVTTVASLWRNHFVLEYQNGFSFVFMHVNPFLPLDECSSNVHLDSINTFKSHVKHVSSDENKVVYENLMEYVAGSDNRELIIGTRSSTNALAKWTKRLIQIQNHLNLVANEVSQVLCNLYDLYFLTVFRICCGNARSESIILGSANRSDFGFNERFPLDLKPSKKQANAVGTVYSSSRRTNILVTSSCVDDINAPFLSERALVTNLEKFITRGQHELSTMVKLDQVEKWQFVGTNGNQINSSDYTFTCLKKRLVAASSCLFVACLLNTSIAHMIFLCETNIIRGYHSSLMDVIMHMKKIMFRVAATRAIGSNSVVSNVS